MASSSNMPATRPRWSNTWLRYEGCSGMTISSEGEPIVKDLQRNTNITQIAKRGAERRLYTSEALEAYLIIHKHSANGMVADIVLINKGNQNIAIIDLWFLYPREGGGGGFQKALKDDTDELIYPILIEPHEVKYVQARHTLSGMPGVGQPNPSREGAIDIPVTLVFTTIGSSSEIQTGELLVGRITVKDGKYIGWGRDTSQRGAVQVRKWLSCLLRMVYYSDQSAPPSRPRRHCIAVKAGCAGCDRRGRVSPAIGR
jgi:hypothetical protein